VSPFPLGRKNDTRAQSTQLPAQRIRPHRISDICSRILSPRRLYGNANALIKGTIINYSDSATVVEGNATMSFDRAGSTKIPAGFDLYRELDYNPSSYTEVAL
jgi:hypothetical protein